MMDEYDVFFLRIVWKRNEQRKKERRKEGTKEGRKERKKERNEEIPPLFELFYNETRGFFNSCIYLVIYYICFDVNVVLFSTLPCLVLLKFPFPVVKVVKSGSLVGMRPV